MKTITLTHIVFFFFMGLIPQGVFGVTGWSIRKFGLEEGSYDAGLAAFRFQIWLAILSIAYIPVRVYEWYDIKLALGLMLAAFTGGFLAIPAMAGLRPWMHCVICSLNPPVASFGGAGFFLELTMVLSKAPLKFINIILAIACAIALLWVAVQYIRSVVRILAFGVYVLVGACSGLLALQLGIYLGVLEWRQLYEGMLYGATINVLLVKLYLSSYDIV